MPPGPVETCSARFLSIVTFPVERRPGAALAMETPSLVIVTVVINPRLMVVQYS